MSEEITNEFSVSDAILPANIQHRKKRAMLEALISTLGIISTACKKAQINRCTHYDWLEKDEQYKQAVEAIDDLSLDFSESKLHKLIKDENPAAVFFHLKTKGKKRGYIERQEIESENNHTIQGNVHLYLPDNGRPAPQIESE